MSRYAMAGCHDTPHRLNLNRSTFVADAVNPSTLIETIVQPVPLMEQPNALGVSPELGA